MTLSLCWLLGMRSLQRGSLARSSLSPCQSGAAHSPFRARLPLANTRTRDLSAIRTCSPPACPYRTTTPDKQTAGSIVGRLLSSGQGLCLGAKTGQSGRLRLRATYESLQFAVTVTVPSAPGSGRFRMHTNVPLIPPPSFFDALHA